MSKNKVSLFNLFCCWRLVVESWFVVGGCLIVGSCFVVGGSFVVGGPGVYILRYFGIIIPIKNCYF